MAFRIHESVVRGAIDNRVEGIVRGKVWLEGRAEPVVLELQGNACPDLAGCLLTFSNPLPRHRRPHLGGLRTLQRGSIGDLTASRKVRVFDVPVVEALAMLKRQEKPPEHRANSLYLEWYSDANGRVVIEIHKAYGGLAAVAAKKGLPERVAVEARQELFEIREAILRLMDDFRGRPGPNPDPE